MLNWRRACLHKDKRQNIYKQHSVIADFFWKIPVGKMASPRRGGGGSSAADERILVPVDFEPPSSAGTDDFILRMLCSEDLERDFAAGT